MTARLDWDTYFMDLAIAASRRGTCDRKQVGAALTLGHRLVATGYNGTLPGLPHCDDIGHDLVTSIGDDGKPRENCVATVHAEANVIAQAARFGIATQGSTLYVNTYPCWPCFRLIAAAGIARVIYLDEYRNDERVETNAKRLGISVQRLG